VDLQAKIIGHSAGMDAVILFEIKTDKRLKKKKRGQSHALIWNRKIIF